MDRRRFLLTSLAGVLAAPPTPCLRPPPPRDGAAKMLEEIGISAEVVDPRTTWPLDK
jgi:hypothetical protein